VKPLSPIVAPWAISAAASSAESLGKVFLGWGGATIEGMAEDIRSAAAALRENCRMLRKR
jgi:hypothetical protein